MFKNDTCDILRPQQETIEGEVVYNEPLLVYSGVKCHLSFNGLSPINQTQSIADNAYSFKLYIDNFHNVKVQKNDIINVVTSDNQTFTLRAGASKNYPLTTQIACEVVEIA